MWLKTLTLLLIAIHFVQNVSVQNVSIQKIKSDVNNQSVQIVRETNEKIKSNQMKLIKFNFYDMNKRQKKFWKEAEEGNTRSEIIFFCITGGIFGTFGLIVILAFCTQCYGIGLTRFIENCLDCTYCKKKSKFLN